MSSYIIFWERPNMIYINLYHLILKLININILNVPTDYHFQMVNKFSLIPQK